MAFAVGNHSSCVHEYDCRSRLLLPCSIKPMLCSSGQVRPLHCVLLSQALVLLIGTLKIVFMIL